MAVYTELNKNEVITHMAQYDCGEVIDFKGITAGVENTNYFIYTDSGTYILTLFENRVNPKDIPYFIGAMNHMQSKSIECPKVIPPKTNITNSKDTESGTLPSESDILSLKGKSSILISFLQGSGVENDTTISECAQLGTLVAQCHMAMQDFPLRRKNALTLPQWQTLFDTIKDNITPSDKETLENEFTYLNQYWQDLELPTGAVHTDIFPDNVFFKSGQLSGIIDFYFMCDDFLLYDIAITLNAWCFTSDFAQLDMDKVQAFIRSYESVRPLTATEREKFTVVARGACVRFYITRLYDEVHTPADANVNVKNANEYNSKLKFYQNLETGII